MSIEGKKKINMLVVIASHENTPIVVILTRCRAVSESRTAEGKPSDLHRLRHLGWQQLTIVNN